MKRSFTSRNSASQIALKSEALRLSTFQLWPMGLPSPRAMSAAGFFYKSVADETQCAFCCITISQWETEDNPIEEHAIYAPNCPFISNYKVGNIPLSNSKCVPAIPRTATHISRLGVFPSFGYNATGNYLQFQNETRPDALPTRSK